MLAQAETSATGQILAVVIPIAIGLIVLAGTLIRAWAESKLAEMKIAKAKAEAALAEAEAASAEAKAKAERAKKAFETVVKGVESIKDSGVKDVAKDAVKSFAKQTGQFENVDSRILDLGLAIKRSKAEVKSPKESQ